MVVKSSQNSLRLCFGGQNNYLRAFLLQPNIWAFQGFCVFYLTHINSDIFQELEPKSVWCRVNATDGWRLQQAVSPRKEKKQTGMHVALRLRPTTWKTTEATLRWLVRERGEERERALCCCTLKRRERDTLSLHTAHSECSMCFNLTFHFALALSRLLFMNRFPNTPISACQHWWTNRLRLHTHKPSASQYHTAVDQWRQWEQDKATQEEIVKKNVLYILYTERERDEEWWQENKVKSKKLPRWRR